MPPKNPFRASLSDKAKKMLAKIVEYEEGKVGLDANGQQIKLTPKEIIEDLVSKRHELLEGGVTNRQRLGGMNDELVSLRGEVTLLRELMEAQTAAHIEFRNAMIQEVARLTHQIMLMRQGVNPE